MIIKSFELNKIDFGLSNLYLFYGKNEGAKKEIIHQITSKRANAEIIKYEEKEILNDSTIFEENIISYSLFEKEKIFIIKRTTDKIIKILDKIKAKNLEDITIIFESENLEKKSKIRSFFEKDKKFICMPFYPDNEQTLLKLSINFFSKKKISISRSNINHIIGKCGGDRETLFNELKKIELFSKNGKNINEENIAKLINLSEDLNVSELIDNCLAKNEKKTMMILNENNFSNEDCIIITRVFLNKAKKVLKLSTEFKKNNNIELTISNAKPAIFWKDKEITKQQIYKWKPESIKILIYRLSQIELMIKKNLGNPVNLITDFLLQQLSVEN